MTSSRQVVAFLNGCCSGGIIVSLSTTHCETLHDIGDRLGIHSAKIAYSRLGSTVTDLTQCHDGDVVYISAGEPFNGRSEASTDVRAKRSSSSTPCATNSTGGEWVTLNVGGRYFTTTRSTLTNKDPDSMLARMFDISDSSSTWHSAVDHTGAYMIDRSPTYFEPVLNYLRNGEVVVDGGTSLRGVLAEARFYGLRALCDELDARIADEEPVPENAPLTRHWLVKRIVATPPEWELRCQGLQFDGANLSRLDLRHINFKYASLRRTNFTGANLSYCNFERADMTGAKLDSANLLGVKMLCVNLEGASMQACNFEDPAGGRANMEGATMKHVNLEGSHMAGVNLRVANLKNANLQNCDLRGAVLAGADLENCDLSGCDLQEANLRGANLKGAAFELMLNPLHMSQAVR